MSSSPRRRAREFALQGLYQWLLSGNDPAAIRGQLVESAGFARCDNKLFDRLWQGVTAEYDWKRLRRTSIASLVECRPSKSILTIGAWGCCMRLTCRSRWRSTKRSAGGTRRHRRAQIRQRRARQAGGDCARGEAG
jgi:hypothetical protein